jgi:hypothetical protein
VVAADAAAAIAIRRAIDEVVGDDQVAGVEEPIEAADASVRQDTPHTRPVEHAEDLTRGDASRNPRPPAMQAHVQRLGVADLEQREGRAFAPRCVEDELGLDRTCRRMEVTGELGRVRPRASDDSKRGGGNGCERQGG